MVRSLPLPILTRSASQQFNIYHFVCESTVENCLYCVLSVTGLYLSHAFQRISSGLTPARRRDTTNQRREPAWRTCRNQTSCEHRQLCSRAWRLKSSGVSCFVSHQGASIRNGMSSDYQGRL